MNGTARAVESGWCTFQVADGLYGVELDRVHEVLRPQPLTRVPLAPPAVAGLLNLRGQIVPAVDLRVLFGLPALPGGGGGQVVVRGADGPVALVVDSIGDVRRHDAVMPRASGAPDAPGEGPLCAYTLALPESLLVVLDLDHVLRLAFERPGRDAAASPRPPASRLPGATS